VDKGYLVPIETTRLTDRGAFTDAINSGRENFLDPDKFESMLDIQLARERDITPLPLDYEREH
jgi:hypothetical protein